MPEGTTPTPDPTPDPQPDPKPERTFSADDVEQIVRDRLARDRKDRPSDEEIGELRTKADRLREIEEENATEAEKAANRLKEAEERAEQAERARDESISTTHATLRRAEIVSAAAQQGVDPDIVHALLKDKDFKVSKDGATYEVTIGDDGQVTGAAEAVKAIAESKNLVGSTPPPPGDGGARTPVPPKDLDDQIREAEEAGDVTKAIALKNQKLLAADG